jgi:hypothetical protein
LLLVLGVCRGGALVVVAVVWGGGGRRCAEGWCSRPRARGRRGTEGVCFGWRPSAGVVGCFDCVWVCVCVYACAGRGGCVVRPVSGAMLRATGLMDALFLGRWSRGVSVSGLRVSIGGWGLVLSWSCGRFPVQQNMRPHANAEFPVHTLFRELGWCSREDIGWLVGWAGCCGPGRPGATQWPNDQPRDGRLSESSRMVFVDWPCWRGRTAAPPGLRCRLLRSVLTVRSRTRVDQTSVRLPLKLSGRSANG